MSVKQPSPPTPTPPKPLFLMDYIKMYRIPTKIKWKIYALFQVLKLLLIKICKIQLLDLLFLVVFISFYISRYHFSQILRTSFNNIWKKDFCHEFSFFIKFTQTPQPLNGQNPLSMTKVFYRCSLHRWWILFKPMKKKIDAIQKLYDKLILNLSCLHSVLFWIALHLLY